MISNGDSQLPVKHASKGRTTDVAPLTAKAVALFLKAFAVFSVVVAMSFAAASAANAETRSLKLYFVHTGEKAVITFKRNGKYDPEGLAKLNRFLRDWRRNEPRKMDPRLFDLIWTVYQKTGSSEYINVLCGYRSPGTNEMLRTRSRHTGVAKESQHIQGKAMDFYIPGVPLEHLREIGLKQQEGGVGYYPTSGSPFVHMDVGGVRAWPRASREVLARLFPDGKTIHLPPDGKPMPGYESAMADYKRRMAAEDAQVASIGGYSSKRRNLFQMLFGGGDEDEEPDTIAADDAPSAPAAKTPPAAPAVQVATATPPKQTFIENAPPAAAPAAEQVAINAPIPASRPALALQPDNGDIQTAQASVARNSATDALATVVNDNSDPAQQVASLDGMKIPVPELLAERRSPGDAQPDASVPLPGSRPDYQVAFAEPDMGRPIAVPQPSPQAQTASNDKSDELAQMLQRMAANGDMNAPGAAKQPDQTASAPPAPSPNAAPQPPQQQVAMLTPADSAATPPTPVVRSLAPIPAQKSGPVDAAASDKPKKGGRPTAPSAPAVPAGKLTDKALLKWALAGNRLASARRPVQAPDFNSAKLTEAPKDPPAGNFEARTANIDPARF